MEYYVKEAPAKDVPSETEDKDIACKNTQMIHVLKKCSETAHRKPISDDANILCTANNWCFLFDDDNNKLVFPTCIAETTRCPDGVILSSSLKQVVLLEITVPDEDRLYISHDLKMSKYTDLVLQCQTNGWKCNLFTVEVGSRGYVSQSLVKFLKFLGLSNRAIKLARNECSIKALRCSYVIYLHREKKNWNPWCW